MARRALVRPPFNFSSALMWRDPTFKQLKTWDFSWFCTVQTSPVCEKITSLSISSSVIFLSSFVKNTFSSMVPLLQKLSFFWSIFDSLRFDTVYKHSKRVSRVRVVVDKTLRKRRRTNERRTNERTDGHQKLNVAYTKALRAIIMIDLLYFRNHIFTGMYHQGW